MGWFDTSRKITKKTSSIKTPNTKKEKTPTKVQEKLIINTCIWCKKRFNYAIQSFVCVECQKELKNYKFPSHTLLYKTVPIWEKAFVDQYIQGYQEEVLKYEMELEYQGWDILFKIEQFGTKAQQHKLEELKNLFGLAYEPVFIEYKSSIDEWGKQIDQFLRQIKQRPGMSLFVPKKIVWEYPNIETLGTRILLTFDPRFNDYFKLLLKARIHLFILDYNVLQEVLNLEKKD